MAGVTTLDQQTVAIVTVGIVLAVLQLRTTAELRADVRELRTQVAGIAQCLAYLEGWLHRDLSACDVPAVPRDLRRWQHELLNPGRENAQFRPRRRSSAP